MIESVEMLVETSHGRIYAECEGDPARGAVVLAAGGPGVGHDHYHRWFSRLAGNSAVVYLDYSGCGRSDRLPDGSEYSVELFGDNIDGVRRHLGLDAVDLIGLSFGGFPAVEYALREPGAVRRLVLSNAQVSAASWQRSNIDSVNAELRGSSRGSGSRSAGCASGACSRSTPSTRSSSPASCPTSSGSTRGTTRR